MTAKTKELGIETAYANTPDMNKKNGLGRSWADVARQKVSPPLCPQTSLWSVWVPKKVPTKPPSTFTPSALGATKSKTYEGACQTAGEIPPQGDAYGNHLEGVTRHRPPLEEGSGAPTTEGTERATLERITGDGESVITAAQGVCCAGADATEAQHNRRDDWTQSEADHLPPQEGESGSPAKGTSWESARDQMCRSEHGELWESTGEPVPAQGLDDGLSQQSVAGRDTPDADTPLKQKRGEKASGGAV